MNENIKNRIFRLRRHKIEREGMPGSIVNFMSGKVETVELDDVIEIIDEEKPLIKRFMYEWIEESKKKGVPFGRFISNHGQFLKDTETEKLAEAWLFYPNVNVEEPKYILDIPHSEIGFSRVTYKSLTEQEIKDIDERLWAFAKKEDE